MRLATVYIFGLVCVANLLPVSSEFALAGHDAAENEWSLPAGSTAAIKLFGCIIPLPPGYFLHADAVSPGHLQFNRLTSFGKLGFGKLVIRPYTEPSEDFFDVVGEENIAHLTVIRIISKEGVVRSQHTMTVIHDGQQKMLIVGHDEDWAIPMARYCADHPL